MPNDIDFARLGLRDALDLAILIEDEAEERYQLFAEQMEACNALDSARFFHFMAENEAKHGQELRRRREDRFGTVPATVHSGMIQDVEAPGFDQAHPFMSARQALEVALQAEIRAHDFFAAALPYLDDPEVGALFDELRREEVDHRDLVRKELAKQPPDDGTDLSAQADEPGGMET
jgi:erythrin-vacuolar iron transport family protein